MQHNEGDSMKLTGSVYNIIYRNELNGYTVFELASQDELTVVCGSFASINEGDYMHIQGKWTQHKDYGLQFSASGYELATPDSRAGIEEYLASGVIKGIGPSTARAIVDVFGLDALDIMEMTPNRLTEVNGIGKAKAEMISKSYAEVASLRQDTMFLQSLGLGNAMCARIIKTYGTGVQMRIKSNPYALIQDVDGIGFHTADAIASRLGIAADDGYRISGGLTHVLKQAEGEGHVFLPKELLLQRTCELLRLEVRTVEDNLVAAVMDGQLIMNERAGLQAIYLPWLFRAQARAAKKLTELNRGAEDLYNKKEVLQTERDNGIELAPVQREAVRTCLENGVCVITGGPGTGKTTVIKCILSLLYRHGKSVALCAPTGRAAKRMTEATGAEAKTIHRLLDYSPDGGFKADRDDPLEFDALIVDEASMIDIYIMYALLDALKASARLIIVGDADQLPSVGAGNVLRDIISSGVIPTVKLDRIFRQEEGSMIVLNAHRINSGQMPELNNKSKDFFFEACQDEEDAARCVLSLCTKRLPSYFKIDPIRDIQVLCPQKKGGCGVVRINLLLQQALNPPIANEPEFRAGDYVLRKGDKVMQIRNNYDIKWRKLDPLQDGQGIFNGDIGYVGHVDKDGVTVLFEDGKQATYESALAEDLMLAYAISVHKSQGCEFRTVVIPLISGPPMLYARNLLYTAVTRARQTVMLVGRRETVSRMVSNNTISKRYSHLDVLLKELKDPNAL